MVDGEYQTPGGKQYHFTDQQPTLDIESHDGGGSYE
jgi:hypothetical protein